MKNHDDSVQKAEKRLKEYHDRRNVLRGQARDIAQKAVDAGLQRLPSVPPGVLPAPYRDELLQAMSRFRAVPGQVKAGPAPATPVSAPTTGGETEAMTITTQESEGNLFDRQDDSQPQGGRDWMKI
jgi:hypothetical protein